jgi:hypothetical protein
LVEYSVGSGCTSRATIVQSWIIGLSAVAVDANVGPMAVGVAGIFGKRDNLPYEEEKSQTQDLRGIYLGPL